MAGNGRYNYDSQALPHVIPLKPYNLALTHGETEVQKT